MRRDGRGSRERIGTISPSSKTADATRYRPCISMARSSATAAEIYIVASNLADDERCCQVRGEYGHRQSVSTISALYAHNSLLPDFAGTTTATAGTAAAAARAAVIALPRRASSTSRVAAAATAGCAVATRNRISAATATAEGNHRIQHGRFPLGSERGSGAIGSHPADATVADRYINGASARDKHYWNA